MVLKKKNLLEEEEEVDLTSMIDVVFLLLIYFMVTTTLIKQEADIGIKLPSSVAAAADTPLPEEYIVDILLDGTVLLNGVAMDAPGSRNMPVLVSTLERLKAAADRSNFKTVVILQPDEESPHQSIIDVLNACSKAEVKSVTFGGA